MLLWLDRWLFSQSAAAARGCILTQANRNGFPDITDFMLPEQQVHICTSANCMQNVVQSGMAAIYNFFSTSSVERSLQGQDNKALGTVCLRQEECNYYDLQHCQDQRVSLTKSAKESQTIKPSSS